MNHLTSNKFISFSKILALPLALIITIALLYPAYGEDRLIIGGFSALKPGNGIPKGWELLTVKTIRRHTLYQTVKDEGITVIKATSNDSASGLIRKIAIDPEKYPIIKWKWKVTNIYKKGDATKKSGDDFPARIYVTFKYNPKKAGFFKRAKYAALRLLYGEYPPGGAITYIWASKTPIGAIIPNPYTNVVRMIAIESGKQHLNTWMSEERNIYEDYIKAFGKKPPMISGVAIMTDSDNTGESAISYYGDIVFEKK